MNKLAPGFSLALLAAGILWAGTSVDWDHGLDFSRYQTYSWGKVQASDDLWKSRIMSDIDEQLAAKGWRRVDSGGETTVNAFESMKDQKSLNTFYSGGGWSWGGGFSTTTVDVTEIGTLVVDIFDSQTKKLMWRGVSSDAMSSKPEKDAKKLAKETSELFKNFPPKPKG
jgi:Domain of unknown function (DUF4136)